MNALPFLQFDTIHRALCQFRDAAESADTATRPAARALLRRALADWLPELEVCADLTDIGDEAHLEHWNALAADLDEEATTQTQPLEEIRNRFLFLLAAFQQCASAALPSAPDMVRARHTLHSVLLGHMEEFCPLAHAAGCADTATYWLGELNRLGRENTYACGPTGSFGVDVFIPDATFGQS